MKRLLPIVLVAALASLAQAQCSPGAPTIVEQPVDQVAPRGRPVLMKISASNASTYQWRRNGVNLVNGTKYTGVRTAAMIMRDAQFADEGTFDVLVTNACGTTLSSSTTIGVRCPADLDDGTFTGTRDGGVEINDLNYFVVMYGIGGTEADIDDGSRTGQPDGAVTIEDAIFFIERFAEGC